MKHNSVEKNNWSDKINLFPASANIHTLENTSAHEQTHSGWKSTHFYMVNTVVFLWVPVSQLFVDIVFEELQSLCSFVQNHLVTEGAGLTDLTGTLN